MTRTPEELWFSEPICVLLKEASPRINGRELTLILIWMQGEDSFTSEELDVLRQFINEGVDFTQGDGIRDVCKDEGFEEAKESCAGLAKIAAEQENPMRIANQTALLVKHILKAERKRPKKGKKE